MIGTKSVNLGIRPTNLAYGTGLCARQNGDGIAKKEKLCKYGNQILVIWGMSAARRQPTRGEETQVRGNEYASVLKSSVVSLKYLYM